MKNKFLLILISFLIGAIVSSYSTIRCYSYLLHSQSLALGAMAHEKMENNNSDEAIHLLYQAIGRFSKEPWNYIYLADIYFEKKQYDMAENYYKLGLDLSPEDDPFSHSAERQLQRIRNFKIGKDTD